MDTSPLRGPWLGTVFFGPNGLRAFWRLLVFFAIFFGFVFTVGATRRILGHGQPEQNSIFEAVPLGALGIFILFLLASWIMSRIEGRRVAQYGLPIRRAFRQQFWQGLLIGFGSITTVLGILRAIGVFHFGEGTLHGTEIFEQAASFGFNFLLVGVIEEFFFRGYVLFTLTSGIRFWPAAILTTSAFTYAHHSNMGETWSGLAGAGAFGLVCCLMLRRTGDLWMPIGFHAAWDWGETYFYGVPNSGGQAPQGHLLDGHFSGPMWLTGGTAGPEGSLICLLIMVLIVVLFLWDNARRDTGVSGNSGGAGQIVKAGAQ